MTESQCKDCQNFRQHYAFDERKIFRVYCGHCTLPGCRRKRPDAPACPQFLSGAGKEDAFATKEYLSEALLEYLFRLELLPPIEDTQ